MVDIELRNVLEYDAKTGYEIFMQDYIGLCYLDSSSTKQTPRKPEITNFVQYEEFLKQSNIFFIVSSKDNEIGYIMLDVFNKGVAQIKEIAIRKEFRHKGYGKQAIKTLIRELKDDEDIKKIVVISATIDTDNFYSSCNFRFISGDMYEYVLR